MAFLGPQELQAKLDEVSNQIKVGQRYVHYKDPTHTYIVTDLVIIEATTEVGVVYEPEYFPKDATMRFVRPLTVWNEMVEWEGKQVKRFTLIT